MELRLQLQLQLAAKKKVNTPPLSDATTCSDDAAIDRGDEHWMNKVINRTLPLQYIRNISYKFQGSKE